MLAPETIQLMVQEIVRAYAADAPSTTGDRMIPTGVSNRHVHLAKGDLETLFGEGYELQPFKDLIQPGQYAAKETLTVVGPKGALEGVRVLGPVRNKTDIEILKGDSFRLGIADQLHSRNFPGLFLTGPRGVIRVSEEVTVAQRHVHTDPENARRLSVTDGQEVRVRAGGCRSLVFEKVRVRVDPNFRLEFHVDIEEANAAKLANGDSVELLD